MAMEGVVSGTEMGADVLGGLWETIILPQYGLGTTNLSSAKTPSAIPPRRTLQRVD